MACEHISGKLFLPSIQEANSLVSSNQGACEICQVIRQLLGVWGPEALDCHMKDHWCLQMQHLSNS